MYKYNSKNSGSPFSQWLKGIHLAKGEYVWIAESDDSSSHLFLEVLIKEIQNRKSISLIHCDSRIINEYDIGDKLYSEIRNDIFKCSLWSTNFTLTSEVVIQQYLIYENIINNVSSALIKKESLQNIVNISNIESYKNAGDYWLYLEILKEYDYHYIHQPLNYYRWHQTNTTRLNIKTRNVNREDFQITYNFIVANLKLHPQISSEFIKPVKYMLLKQSNPVLSHLKINQIMDYLTNLRQIKTIDRYDFFLFLVLIFFQKLKIKRTYWLKKIIIKNNIY